MTPKEALALGQLSDAIVLQRAAVVERAAPAAQLFLVELLTVAGDYRGAWAMLNAIKSDDPAWPKSRRQFREAIRLLARRRNGLKPQFLTAPPKHSRCRLRLLRAVSHESVDDALTWLDRADHSSPALAGHVDGREIEGWRDADDRFASVLEAFIDGGYHWLPWETVRRVRLAPAVNLFDRVVRMATVKLATDEEIRALLPLVYPVHYELPDEDDLALGLDAERAEEHGGVTIIRGGKMFLCEAEEIMLGDCRQVDLRIGG